MGSETVVAAVCSLCGLHMLSKGGLLLCAHCDTKCERVVDGVEVSCKLCSNAKYRMGVGPGA